MVTLADLTAGARRDALFVFADLAIAASTDARAILAVLAVRAVVDTLTAVADLAGAARRDALVILTRLTHAARLGNALIALADLADRAVLFDAGAILAHFTRRTLLRLALAVVALLARVAPAWALATTTRRALVLELDLLIGQAFKAGRVAVERAFALAVVTFSLLDWACVVADVLLARLAEAFIARCRTGRLAALEVVPLLRVGTNLLGLRLDAASAVLATSLAVLLTAVLAFAALLGFRVFLVQSEEADSGASRETG